MDQLPSVWGQHSIALIEAIVVRGRVITSILDAPDGWADRLASIGFKKTPQAWLRIGAMSQTEYQFVSSEIKLVGLRSEHVIDLPEEHHEANPVPYDVKDALLGLWQRQVTALLVALSMEHDAHYTRSQAWSFVEAALEGEITPETETLLGLTFTKMARDGLFSPHALAYAQSLGWTGGSSQPGRSAGKTLLSKGESIQWADKDGVVHSGRIAQRLQHTDVGCWVYKSAPVWAGGYVAASPLWVKREQLQFSGWAPDWQESDLAKAMPTMSARVNPSSIDSDLIIPVSGSQQELLGAVLKIQSVFPSSDWRSVCAAIGERAALAAGAEGPNAEFNDAFAWLEALEQHLASFSSHYYGPDPLQFVITGDTSSLDVTLAVATGSRVATSSWYTMSGQVEGGQIELGRVAAELERDRDTYERRLRDTASQLGSYVGTPGLLWPMPAMRNHRAGIWPEVAEHYQGHVTADGFVRLQSILAPETNLIHALSRSQVRDEATAALSTEIWRLPSSGMGQVTIDLVKFDASFARVQALVDSLGSEAIAPDWMNLVAQQSATLYQVKVDLRGGIPLPDLMDVPGVSVYVGGLSKSSALQPDLDKALAAYRAVLSALEGHVDAVTGQKLVELHEISLKLPLMQRFKDAAARVQTIPRVQVERYVEAELHKTFKSKVAEWTDNTRNKVISALTTQMLSSGAQGVAAAINTRGAYIRWTTAALPLTASAVAQSRLAEIQGGVADRAKTRQWSGTAFGIDAIALADPELCEIVNGVVDSSLALQRTSASAGSYEDTGTVAGFAAKDIRGFASSDLIAHADRMSDQQKAKYITKELIWPRRSFEELKESGCGLAPALAHDVLWKGLPKQPKSPSRLHVVVFIDLITAVKKAVEPLITTHPGRSSAAPSSSGFMDFASAMESAVVEACDRVSDLTKVYGFKDQAIRGMTFLRWTDFQLGTNSAFWRKAASLSWSDVLKTKKLCKPGPERSRVLKGEVVREGKDYRQGRSVTSEDFIRTFGFSGVEYGNWTNQKEREKHLNFAFDSMMDFAESLGWEPMTLSLAGKLGLCIGSRGTGGPRPANAHFEPANMAINLTRMKGDGALAHEYFHAVAGHYGRIATGLFQDVTDTFSYGLQKAGDLPAMPSNGMREEVSDAFYALMVSIMRQPDAKGDSRELSSYREPSAMLRASLAMEKSGGDYWASPREMFARAMEIWFKDKISANGQRNDYLVSARKFAGSHDVYPDAVHLERIKQYADQWVEAVVQEVRVVDHPFMGSVEMPILNTEHKSTLPLSANDLAELAHDQLEQLFRMYAPAVEIVNDPFSKAGMWSLAEDLVTLNANSADAGAFYHEAWHACDDKLLTAQERRDMASLFSTQGAMATLVADTMHREGFGSSAVAHALSDTRELQAYAFQLWVDGKLSLLDVGEFYRVRGFANGVKEVAGLFGPVEVQRLFERFKAGDLAERRQQADRTLKVSEVEIVAGDDPHHWDSDNTVFWSVEEMNPAVYERPRHMRMR